MRRVRPSHGKLRAHSSPTTAGRPMRIGVKGRLALYVIVFSAFLAVGAFLAVQGWQDRALVRPIPNGLTAVGHVVDYKTSVYKGASYAAVVQFEAADGQVVRFTAPSTIHRPQVGAAVEVSYLLLRPFQAHDLSVPGWTWQWEFFAGLGVVAIMLSMGSLAVYLTVRLRRSEMDPADPRPALAIRHVAVGVERTASVLPLVLVPFVAVLVFYGAFSRTQRIGESVACAGAFLVFALLLMPPVRRTLRRRRPSKRRRVSS